MILNFSIENYRSIRERQDFSFIKLDHLKHKQLKDNYFSLDENLSVLNVALIYGRNASGKSNILRSVDVLRDFVINSSSHKLDEEIKYYDPFLFDKDSSGKPTKFWIEFVTKGDRYSYHIEFDDSVIHHEVLKFYPKGYPAMLFERVLNQPINFGTYLKGDKKSIEKQLLDNQLFLSKAANSNQKQLTIPYLAIRNDISPVITSDDTNISSQLIRSYCKILVDKEDQLNFRHNLNRIINVADTGIKRLIAEENPDIENQVPDSLTGKMREDFLNRNKFKLSSIHRFFDENTEAGEVRLKFDEESSGTKKLLSISGIAVMILTTGGTLIIDEFDNSLHPRLSRFLIKLFQSKKYNKRYAQLLFSTHDVSLMSENLFRRDQVWFTEKNTYGATELYSLADFKGVRKDAPIEKWYLSGRFGATPVIDEVDLDLKLD